MRPAKGLRWKMLAFGAMTASTLLFTGCADEEEVDPRPEGALEIPGLSDEVQVRIDEEAIPRIRCKTAADCTAALGYLHARDRFIQMEVRRSFVRGRLHTVVNPSFVSLVAPIDQSSRTMYLTRDGRPIEEAAIEHASEETLAILEAYTQGVNVFLAEAREDKSLFSDEFQYRIGPLDLLNVDGILDWTVEDSLASVVALVDALTNSSSEELTAADRMSVYSYEVFTDLLYSRPVSPATTLFGEWAPAALSTRASAGYEQHEAARAYGQVLSKAKQDADLRDAVFGKDPNRGSNNWAVGKDKTASGNAILSDDPHLSHTSPATWYIVEMEAEDGSMHVAGVSFAGLPWVILGQNKDIAWGATTTYFDQADVFLETLTDDGNHVVYDGEEVELLTYDTSVTAGRTTVPGTAKIVPHHGPIIAEHDGRAVSMRWTGADLSTDVNFLTQLMKATSVDEGQEATKLVTTLGQNWVMIDTAGNFGWFPYNLLPKRSGLETGMRPGLPLPGDGSVKWDGYHELSELPQLKNNPEGFVATANNDMTGQLWDGDPTNDNGMPLFQSSVADGLRQERILDLLGSTDQHTQDTMLETVGDTYMLLRDYVVEPLQTILNAEDDPALDDARQLMDSLQSWSGYCPTGLATSDPDGDASSDADERDAAKNCLIFHRLVNDLRHEIFQDEINEESSAAGRTSSPRAQLSALTALISDDPRMLRTDYWDDVRTPDIVESPGEIIGRAVDATYAWLTDKLGDDEENWLWGRLHRITLTADLFPEFNVNDFNNGPYAVEGGLSTVNVATPTQAWNDGFDISSGASMRWICEGFPEGMSCNIQVPGGQVHQKSSPYYANFLERWLVNTPHEMALGTWAGEPIQEITFIKAP